MLVGCYHKREVSEMIANLKMLREKKGISQQTLADIFGISQQSVNNYENHETEPDIYMLMKLADYFEVSVDLLIGHTTKQNTNANEAELVEKYRLLTPSEQESIRMIIDNYIK